MTGFLRVVLICLLTGGCAFPGMFERSADPPRDAATDRPAPGGSDGTAGDTEDEAGADAAGPARVLPATTVASLGDVARPGLWMRTPLVTEPMPGRVSDPATGAVAVVELLPLEAAPGAGSRLSLAAYRALNLPLTSLPELRVTAAE